VAKLNLHVGFPVNLNPADECKAIESNPLLAWRENLRTAASTNKPNLPTNHIV
jgi:hypothetical protein